MDSEATQQLIERSQQGDPEARDALFRRCSERLRRWARGRLPSHARDIADTQDLVQVTLLRAFRQLDGFESRGEGSFMAYLRGILLNRVKEELRRAGRQPASTERLDLPAGEPGLSAQLGELQLVEAYEQALESLGTRARDAVVLRLEFDLSYAEIAEELGAPSADAARMLVARSLRELAARMPQDSTGST
ncbi:RNA polymerase sigma factor [Pseudomarimonas salicorniae]|uniref:RNA polymerase sigma factor n=1 Tax=Pseudomarimonas salicorniae TaxID=2933270 RepID=A0ABT0GM13_9GAMM|nr:RNA polymerase sigma factor [Lysobacter sp. CAU 1642]MCK7595579.1 RNA polymerase sigma factor [Lysobacter sp. CAU 1642]